MVSNDYFLLFCNFFGSQICRYADTQIGVPAMTPNQLPEVVVGFAGPPNATIDAIMAPSNASPFTRGVSQSERFFRARIVSLLPQGRTDSLGTTPHRWFTPWSTVIVYKHTIVLSLSGQQWLAGWPTTARPMVCSRRTSHGGKILAHEPVGIDSIAPGQQQGRRCFE